MGVRIGVCFDARHPDVFGRSASEVYQRTVDLAVASEIAGVDVVWFSEHHQFDDGYLPQPLTMAAAVAARTSRVRLSTAVLVAPLHHPRHVAEQAAVVDVLSGGRLELGLGAGYRAAEFACFGVDPARRFSALAEAVSEIADRWADVQPRPTQPTLPLWLGCNGPRGAALAGQRGTGIITTDPLRVAEYLATLAPGVVPRVAAMVRLLVADDPERAWAHVGPHVLWQWDAYRRAALAGTGRTPRPLDADRLVAFGDDLVRPDVVDGISSHRLDGLRFGVGTLGEVEKFVEALAAVAPVTDLITPGWIAAAPDEVTERHLELVSRLGRPGAGSGR